MPNFKDDAGETMWEKIVDRICAYPNAKNGYCVAFSGGVDSALVLQAALEAAQKNDIPREKVHAVYFSTFLHPVGEPQAAKNIAVQYGANFEIIEIDELRQAGIENNPPDRCYRCKRLLFSKLSDFANERQIYVLLDGTNLDDTQQFRPGLKALEELAIKSPLKECDITKAQVRQLAREKGIVVFDKPSSPCLATRIEYNTPILREDIERIGRAEAYLKSLNFLSVRVRKHRTLARIEVPVQDISRLAHMNREISSYFADLGFDYITLDLSGLKSGSMDIPLSRG